MEFIQISKKKILIYAEIADREAAIKKLIEKFLDVIKAIQAELK